MAATQPGPSIPEDKLRSALPSWEFLNVARVQTNGRRADSGGKSMTTPASRRGLASTECEPTIVHQLAQKVFGWSVAPDRYLTVGRSWIPRWRFRPLDRIEDAFCILDHVAPDEFRITGGKGCPLCVKVRIGERVGEARGASGPATITWAVAKALGLGGEH